MNFKPSKDQQNIFKFIKNDNKNAIISAVAGSGKTTTLIKSLELIPTDKTVLFMAYNKSIADELKLRVPKTSNIEVKTVHGFGYSTLMKSMDVTIENRKYSKILRDVLDSHINKTKQPIEKYKFNKVAISIVSKMSKCSKVNTADSVDYLSNITSLANLGRLNLIDIDDMEHGHLELVELSKLHSIGTQDGEIEIAWYLIKLGTHHLSEIDFTDMIFLPSVLKNVKCDIYDFVFIDECQDLNTCQRILMECAIKPKTGRFIAVGDPKQAIYGFAGADFNSFKRLCEIPNTIQLPLSVTYRCATDIVNMVKSINPFIKPIKNADKGEILNEFSYKDILDGDMVLCRQTLPVVSLCIRLLIEGKRAHVMGSDIGMSLCKMISDCERVSEEFNMVNVFSRLYNEKKKIIDKLILNHNMTREEANEDEFVNQYNEKIQVIEALSDKITNPHEVITKIRNLFADTKKVGITLSTIHKSKGLESDRVFILQKDLMPSKYAKTSQQVEQEENLKYVAYTRAKKTLGFISDFNAYSGHKSQSENIKPVIESKHVGIVDTKMDLKLTVLSTNTINTIHGECLVIELKDKNSNIFTKFGDIKEKFIVSEEKVIKQGTNVEFTAFISGHLEFKGVKKTKLGRLS